MNPAPPVIKFFASFIAMHFEPRLERYSSQFSCRSPRNVLGKTPGKNIKAKNVAGDEPQLPGPNRGVARSEPIDRLNADLVGFGNLE